MGRTAKPVIARRLLTLLLLDLLQKRNQSCQSHPSESGRCESLLRSGNRFFGFFNAQFDMDSEQKKTGD